MLKRLITKQTNTITGAAIVLAIASLISRIIGLLRDRLFAHLFGAGTTLDAYYAAFRLPDLVYNLLVVGALSAGFIPIFRKLYDSSPNKAWRFIERLTPVLGVILVVLSAFIALFAPLVVPLLVPGFDPATQSLTILMTRIMCFSPILLGLSSIASGALQALKSFIIYSLTPIVYNIGIIIGAFLFVPKFGPQGLAWGVLLGAFMHLLIQLPTLYKYGFKFKFAPKIDKDVRKLGKMMIPRVIALGASQLTFLALTVYASSLASGSLTIFTFAQNIQFVPVGMIGISFALAAFPTLCENTKKSNRDIFIRHLSATTRKILFFITPITLTILLLRAQIVRVLLGSGAFDWIATINTADALAFFALSLFAQALVPLYARAFFALEDTRSPLIASVLGMIITINFAHYYSFDMGVSGLALAFSLGATAQALLLIFMLRNKLGSIDGYKVSTALQKISIAAIAMAVITQLLKIPLANIVDMTRLWGVLLQASVAGGFGLLVYAGVCSLLNLQEMTELSGGLKKRFLNFKHVEGTIADVDEV